MEQPPYTDNRHIRVFVSSTFLDMQEERNVLIKKIFPQLRKKCEERAVTWTEVDLRWGITDEEAAEGKVLPLCLEEIQRCRPYFIGLLGERYGWIPNRQSISTDLLESQPWLRQHLGQSVTELEILQGVFSEKMMPKHAFFYFRNPMYLESIPIEKLRNFSAESSKAASKLTSLKRKIRHARDEQVCELRENYNTPEQLGEWVLEDFSKLVDRLYPKDQTPDQLDQEAARHEAYARNRRLAFVGREDILYSLNERIAASEKPIILTGESGCGKSALLAEWAARRRKDRPNDLIVQHYIGSTPESSDWQVLVRRILGELKRAYDIIDEIPSQAEALHSALNNWVAKATGLRKTVLILDAINQIAEDNVARQCDWLPVIFPSNFLVLVSTLPGESLDALRKRDWPELSVPLFEKKDIIPATLAYLQIFGKKPPDDILKKLESNPSTCNALYLRAVLDELRQFGKHEELLCRAIDYLSAPDLPRLFDRILTRWNNDFGMHPVYPDIVGRSLCLMACARFGLTETELLEMLQKDGKPLTRQLWTPIYLAMENALSFRSGLLNFGHSHLRHAVMTRFFNNTSSESNYHQIIAEYFNNQEGVSNRKRDELPWQYSILGQSKDLKRVMTNSDMFLALSNLDRFQIWRYCSKLMTREAGLWDIYKDSVEQWHDELGDSERYELALNEISHLLYVTNDESRSFELLEKAYTLAKTLYSVDNIRLAIRQNNMAACYGTKGDWHKAHDLWLTAHPVYEKEFGDNHPDMWVLREGLAVSLIHTKQIDEGMAKLNACLEWILKHYGKMHFATANCLSNLAIAFTYLGRFDKTANLFKDVVIIAEKVLGGDNPRTIRWREESDGFECVAKWQAHAIDMEKSGNLAEALKAYERMEEQCAELASKPGVSFGLFGKAKILKDMDRLVESKNNADMALMFADAVSENLAEELRHFMVDMDNDYEQLNKASFGSVQSIHNVKPLTLQKLANKYYQQGDYIKAEKLLRQLLKQCFELPGIHCHLARVLVMQDRIGDAGKEIQLAWEHYDEAPAYVIAHILLFQIAFSLLDGTDPSPHLGRLKTALGAAGAFREWWNMTPVLEKLHESLSPDNYAFLTALVAALNTKENLSALDAFPVWREAKPEPLE